MNYEYLSLHISGVDSLALFLLLFVIMSFGHHQLLRTNYTQYFFEKYLTRNVVQQMQDILGQYIHVVYVACALYVVLIHTGVYVMKDRKPFKLKSCLIVWNSALAVFSIWGTCRVTHHLVIGVAENGINGYFVCDYREEDYLIAFWKRMFGISKVIELGDTAFIVLRKSRLTFLHWYHHVTVLLYTIPLSEYVSRSVHTNAGSWFAGVNFGVHAIMYTYYTLRSLGIKVWKPIAMSITTVQILQMVGGLWAGFYIPWWKCGKPLTSFSMMATSIMYFSYFLLFCNYFTRAYLRKSKLKGAIKLE